MRIEGRLAWDWRRSIVRCKVEGWRGFVFGQRNVIGFIIIIIVTAAVIRQGYVIIVFSCIGSRHVPFSTNNKLCEGTRMTMQMMRCLLCTSHWGALGDVGL